MHTEFVKRRSTKFVRFYLLRLLDLPDNIEWRWFIWLGETGIENFITRECWVGSVMDWFYMSSSKWAAIVVIPN